MREKNKKLYLLLASFIFVVVLITVYIAIAFNGSIFSKNIVSNKLIYGATGWKNNRSFYSGSELQFLIRNSGKISFQFTSSSRVAQGAEIFIDKDAYFISSPNLNKQQLLILVDKHKLHTVRIRHFCTAQEFPCDITLKNIYVDTFAELFPYQESRKIVSILGDSISAIYGKDNYSFLLADALGYQLHNASIFGSTVSKVKGFDNAISRYQKDLRGFDSNAIIIFLGTNDAASNVPLKEFENDYSTIVDTIKKSNPKSKIFLTRILSRGDVDYHLLNNYNNIIKNLSLKYNASFIDTSYWLDDRDFSDMLHPSLQSQIKIAEKFSKIILPIKN